MKARLTLVSHALCPYVQRAAIALIEKDVDFERITIDLVDKPAWFKAISPLGRVPLLKVGDEAVLFESAAICEYLEDTTAGPLHPTDPAVRARHRAWMEFGSNVLNLIAGFYNAADADALQRKRDEIRERFITLEAELSSHEGPYFRFFAELREAPAWFVGWVKRSGPTRWSSTWRTPRGSASLDPPYETVGTIRQPMVPEFGEEPYFSGARFSLVDAVFAPVFRYFERFEAIEDFGFFDGLLRVTAWRAALAQRPSVKAAAHPDYANLLDAFLKARHSELSRRMAA
jgi:glutathione S-transferase